MLQTRRGKLAYLIGLAIGDGNLSNPNGRAVRLRITCDNKYPKLRQRIIEVIQEIMPKNKVAIAVRKQNCCDVSCYSNQWEKLLGWKAKNGPKHKQNIKIPTWILNNKKFSIECLRGLIETDGSVYSDRGYIMVNFVTIMPKLANEVLKMIVRLNFKANLYKIKTKNADKHTIRISKRTKEFIKTISLKKE
ncbi:MAG: hypothetical protein HY979_02795 [Candidatus Magasanikbacteria bacterium]|nr:hypothetical protein [Candidatus Magasanikbacteria bacterium]